MVAVVVEAVPAALLCTVDLCLSAVPVVFFVVTYNADDIKKK